jgi:hypothetical protein
MKIKAKQNQTNSFFTSTIELCVYVCTLVHLLSKTICFVFIDKEFFFFSFVFFALLVFLIVSFSHFFCCFCTLVRDLLYKKKEKRENIPTYNDFEEEFSLYSSVSHLDHLVSLFIHLFSLSLSLSYARNYLLCMC